MSDVTTPRFTARWLVVSGNEKKEQLLFLDLMIPRKNDERLVTLSYNTVKNCIDRPTIIMSELEHMNWITSDADVHEILSYMIRFKEGVDRK